MFYFFFRAILHDATIHNQDIVKLRDKIESLPEQNAQVEKQLATITQQHAKILKRAQVKTLFLARPYILTTNFIC